MTPAVQLYTVRDALGIDRPAALARLASLGFHEVELFGFVDDVDGWARDLATAGLTAVSGHASLVAMDPRPALEAADALGLRFLIEPAVPRERWASMEHIVRTADALAAAAEAAPAGVTVGYHNHAWELESRIDGRPALAHLAELLDPSVVLEVDAYWAAAGGVDAPAFLREFGDRVALVHVKDGKGTADVLDQVAAGSGDLDVAEVLEAAPQAVHVLELDAFRGDPFDALEAGLRYMGGRA